MMMVVVVVVFNFFPGTRGRGGVLIVLTVVGLVEFGLVLGGLENRSLGVLDEHLGDGLHVDGHPDGGYRAPPEPRSDRQTEHEVLHVLLVAVVGEVQRAYSSGLDVERYVSVGQGNSSAGPHPPGTNFRYLREAVVADAPTPGAPVAVAARSYRALWHLLTLLGINLILPRIEIPRTSHLGTREQARVYYRCSSSFIMRRYSIEDDSWKSDTFFV